PAEDAGGTEGEGASNGPSHIDLITKIINGENVELPPEVSDPAPNNAGTYIPLIAVAAENEVPPENPTAPADGGAAASGTEAPDPAPARAYRPNGKSKGSFDKAKLPLNLEFLFRFLGKSASNVKKQRDFASRNPDLHTTVAVIDEIGYGNGN